MTYVVYRDGKRIKAYDSATKAAFAVLIGRDCHPESTWKIVEVSGSMSH